MRILQSLLFATDFLPATQDAARVVTQLASVFDSHLTLLHVLEPVLTEPADLHRQRDQATTRMRELVEQLGLDTIVIDEVSIGVCSPAETIVRKARAIDADLVLIGTGETSRFGPPAGPTAEAVLQHANQPVLAVRPGKPSVQFRQILCPVDHSTVSRRGLRNAIRLARAFHGNVVVLSVVPAASWLPWGEETGTQQANTEHERIWPEEFEHILQGDQAAPGGWTGVPRSGTLCRGGRQIPPGRVPISVRDHRPGMSGRNVWQARPPRGSGTLSPPSRFAPPR